MTIDETRKRNLRLLVTAAGGPLAFGKAVDRDSKYISQLISFVTKKAIGSKICRHFERELSKPKGWMDSPQWPVDSANDAEAIGEAAAPYELSPREARFVDCLRQADERTKNILDAVLASSDEQVKRSAK